MSLFSSMLLSLLLLLVGPLLASCTSTTNTTPAEDAAVVVQQENRMLRQRRSRLGFYESRRDARLCPSPYCGGAFVRPIDGSMIKCLGASTEATTECYVGALRYPRNDPPPPPQDDTGITIVYGRIVPGRYSGAPDINDFAVRDGTIAASRPIPLYYSVEQDLRDCVFPLCGGYWLSALATTKTLCSDGSVADACYVVSFNLSRLGLTPKEEQAVLAKIISEGGPVKGYYIDNTDYDTTNWPELKDLLVLEAP
jgi:hypothetical protein